ncbi:DUF554 domain-containing protein [Anaeromyxobacter paludicola]|uniref:DUF554 domain-containing protein n=1 Tax=Anaeromyxobacter paludicola TaxID=2918171 RepID=A0ABN6NFN8_9BACT|nr:DUF554 domain-containing protein [Anaeromyxobacter paludicola]BDG10858.1 hypothetical protein AMPC_39710 [Anaeromyxobacter paludicola]
MIELFARTSGTWVNVATVAGGTALGLLVGARLPEKMGRTLMQVLGLVTAYVGLSMAGSLRSIESARLPGVMVALVGLALGGLVGEALGIEERLGSLGETLRRRFRGSGRFTEGFVTASLLFCVGPMAIVGSLQNGLSHKNAILVLKAALDGIASIALSGVYGIGVGFSALTVLALQGGLSLAAGALAASLPDPSTDPSVLVITGTGGLMIIGIGVNLMVAGLGVEDRRVRVGALLPALAIAPVLHALVH